jgi:hypothetical protein
MADLAFVPLAPRRASAKGEPPSRTHPQSAQGEVPGSPTPGNTPGRMTQPADEAPSHEASQDQAAEDLPSRSGRMQTPHVASHDEAAEGLVASHSARHDRHPPPQHEGAQTNKKSSESGDGPNGPEPRRHRIMQSPSGSLADAPVTGTNQTATTNGPGGVLETQSLGDQGQAASECDIGPTSVPPKTAAGLSDDAEAPPLRNATQATQASPGDSPHEAAAHADTRLQALHADMRMREIIRCEAVRLAAIACGRALRRAMLMHPNALASFVDEAIAAAGHPPDARVHVHPAIQGELESVGRVCHEDAGLAEDEIALETRGGMIRGDPSTCARLLVCAASQADGDRAAARDAIRA